MTWGFGHLGALGKKADEPVIKRKIQSKENLLLKPAPTSRIEPRCTVRGCAAPPLYTSPADLCEVHWVGWFDGEFEIQNRRVAVERKK